MVDLHHGDTEGTETRLFVYRGGTDRQKTSVSSESVWPKAGE